MINIIINDKTHSYPEDSLTVENLLKSLNKTTAGTAVAVNGMLVRKENWPVTLVHDGDSVTLISAAFGG